MMPAEPKKKEPVSADQAVIKGVIMKKNKASAVAVREAVDWIEVCELSLFRVIASFQRVSLALHLEARLVG